MFNEELNIPRAKYADYTVYSIDFKFSGKDYIRLGLQADAAGGNMYFPHSSTTNSGVYSHGNWLVDGRIIRFTGGEDATNADLIAFIQENAERIKSITDTIAEKLVIIAENEQKVYDAGYQKGKTDGGGYTDEDIEASYNAGKQAEYDAFWNAYQMNGTRANYQYGAFGGVGWTDETFKPKYVIKPKYPFGMFTGCRITKIKDIDFSIAADLGQTMYQCAYLKEVGVINAPIATNALMCFSGDYALHTIEKMVVGEQCTFDQTFINCSALKNIVFEGIIGNNMDFRWSTLLTRASIESIVNHLSDDALSKTLTLSKTAVDDAFIFYFEEIEVPGSDETNPYWTPLRDSKPNWTITLV